TARRGRRLWAGQPIDKFRLRNLVNRLYHRFKVCSAGRVNCPISDGGATSALRRWGTTRSQIHVVTSSGPMTRGHQKQSTAPPRRDNEISAHQPGPPRSARALRRSGWVPGQVDVVARAVGRDVMAWWVWIASRVSQVSPMVIVVR